MCVKKKIIKFSQDSRTSELVSKKKKKKKKNVGTLIEALTYIGGASSSIHNTCECSPTLHCLSTGLDKLLFVYREKIPERLFTSRKYYHSK